MGECKCGKEMFLFDETYYSFVYVCPHCKRALQMLKSTHQVVWHKMEDINLTLIDDDYDIKIEKTKRGAIK